MPSKMARKKIREYDSKRILKEHLKRIAGISLGMKSAQVCLNLWFEQTIVNLAFFSWLSQLNLRDLLV